MREKSKKGMIYYARVATSEQLDYKISKTSKMPRVALYCRTAVKNPAEITAQVKALENYAMQHHIENCEVYADDGHSGSTILGRPAFSCLTEDIRNGRIKTLIVTKNHRLSRDIKRSIEIEQFLIENQVEHIEITPQCDDSIYSDFEKGIIDKNKYLAMLESLNVESSFDEENIEALHP